MTKNTHGGAGRGQGRKPLTPTEPTVKVAVTLLESQVESMKQLGNGNLSAGIRKAIESMTIYIIINERYSNEPVPATVADLRQLAAENGWEVEFTETTRNGKTVIIDQRNEIVAEAEQQ